MTTEPEPTRMLDDVIHPLSEFANLPWDKLDPERCCRDWSFGRGGHGFNDRTWTISIYHDVGERDLQADIWELPPQIGEMLRVVREAERKDVRHEIRNTLGID